MALPTLKTLSDCASFSRTVTPFIPQLQTLPQRVFSSISDPQELKNIYLTTNPLITAFAISLALAPIFLIVSEANKNYSQVDRLWSILPTFYNAHYTIWAHMVGLPTKRLDNMLAFSVVWSIRLTFNYWRKGGYSVGSEDYRWQVLREKISPALMFLFNVLFISLAQSVLLFLITSPTYVLMLAGRLTGEELSWADFAFSRTLMALVLLEFFADQQQWTFQNAKKSYQTTAKVPEGYERADLDRGFLTSGLFRWSRHPNFAAEQAVWLSVYQWASFETYTLYNWTFLGAFSYLILFQASTWFTESISAGKYPEYKDYQARVGKFVPKLFPGPTLGARTSAVVQETAQKQGLGQTQAQDQSQGPKVIDLRGKKGNGASSKKE